MYKIKLYNELRVAVLDPEGYFNTNIIPNYKEYGSKYVRVGRTIRFNANGYDIPESDIASRYGTYKQNLSFIWYVKKFLTDSGIEYNLSKGIERVKLTNKGKTYAYYL